MKEVTLSVIIPVYNEVNTVLEVIRLVRLESHSKEVIVVDDCSTDGTRELLRDLKGDDLKVFFNDSNRGKGYCVRKAFENISGDIVIIQDADLEYYPDEYAMLIEKIVHGKADVVYGSRFLGAHRVFYFYHYLGNLLLNLIANIFLNANLTDLMTGFKAMRSSVAKKLTLLADGFGIETEITAEVFKRNYSVYEVPVSYNGRDYDEGKKIRWFDFFRCLYWLFRAVFRTVDVADDTLLKMCTMENNNTCTYEKISRFLGSNILELGSGIGTFSRFLTGNKRRVVLTDLNEDSISHLKRRFIGNPWVKVIKADVTGIDKELSGSPFDSIVGINILEHIEDDIKLLERIKGLIGKEGNIILVVPAHKWLFSGFDRLIGHYRRYSKKELAGKLDSAGYSISVMEYMNFLSAIGWFVTFRLFKRKRMPSLSIRFFDHFIPLIFLIERYISFPLGLSILCVARKKNNRI